MRLCHDHSGTEQHMFGAQDVQQRLFMLEQLQLLASPAQTTASSPVTDTGLLTQIQQVLGQLCAVSFSN